ncbi:hypothetical protein JCM6882_000938 [Rhodosporidiobolus microsporus]
MSASSVAHSISTSLRAGAAAAPPAIRRTSPRFIASAPFSSATRQHKGVGRACGCAVRGTRSYSSYPSENPDPAAFAPVQRKKRTIMDLHSLKKKGIPITMLTAHDYPSARFIEAAALPSSDPSPSSSSSSSSSFDFPTPASAAASSAAALSRGIDICLVGDSLAMVACGYTSTSQLTLEEMLYHCRSVARGCTTSLLVADLPFGTYLASLEQGVTSAVRLVQEGNMDAVKIEGGQEIVPLVRKLTDNGIPVVAHIGLTPQRQAALSGYRVQGKTVASALKLLDDARAMEAAGAFAVLMEAVPSRVAAYVSRQLSVPTIGIGAGAGTDGQVLVQLDMLGVDSELGASGKGPRFLRKFGQLGDGARAAVREYVRAVREGNFPEEGTHTYPLKEEVWAAFEQEAERLKEEKK